MHKIYGTILASALLFCGCATPVSEAGTSTTAALTTVIPSTEVITTETQAHEAFLPVPTEPDPLEQLLNSLSVGEKVGQLFLARCPSTDAIAAITTYHLGGYLLFSNDFEGQTPASLLSVTNAYQSVSRIPILIAVDEEGGSVTRVSSNTNFRDSIFPSPRTLYSQGGLALILQTEQEKCDLLSSIGVNVNLSPVCDITTNTASFMYRRSLGEDPNTTADFVIQVTSLMQANKIGSVLKHFPGYGNNADTHFGIATDPRPLEELKANDLIPFQAGIDSGCSAIMVSHTIITCMDGTHPATLSPAVHQYLRDEMGFDGVIVTDDLSMGAITSQYGTGEAAVLAVLAGNDLLCSSDYQAQYNAVLDAVTTGRIQETQLNAAVRRILQWKVRLGILTL